MGCPRCEAEEAIGAKYCGGCGRRMQRSSCQRCGAANPSASKFCHECGHALTETAPGPHDAASEAAPWDEPDEIKDSAFWEAYADRTGIPAPGLIEVAPPAERERRASAAVDPDDGQTRWRRGEGHTRAALEDAPERRQRGRRAWPPPEEPERRPIRTAAVTVIVLILILTAVFLSTELWPGRLAVLTQWLAAPDRQTIASRPVLDPASVPAERAAPSAPAAVTEAPSPPDAIVSTEPATPTPAPPSELAPSSLPAAPSPSAAEKVEGPGRSRTPSAREEPASARPSSASAESPPPSTSVERMATFLIERDGPERAVQAALTVAGFYPTNTDDFKYWQRVAAAIRSARAPTTEPGEAGRR